MGRRKVSREDDPAFQQALEQYGELGTQRPEEPTPALPSDEEVWRQNSDNVSAQLFA